MFIEVTSKENGRKYLLALSTILGVGPNPDDLNELMITTTEVEIIVSEDYDYFKNLLSL